ncbi:hypothetical protein ACP2W0_18960 [Pseudobacillus badius]|uniref:hypothetical protein n=1 Tax=Bacillus badius TaxID=1455 RepID=UPI003CF85560
MRQRKNVLKSRIMLAGCAACIVAAFLITAQSYFHHKEIKEAGKGCLEQGGTAVVEKSFLALNYSFSCE